MLRVEQRAVQPPSRWWGHGQLAARENSFYFNTATECPWTNTPEEQGRQNLFSTGTSSQFPGSGKLGHPYGQKQTTEVCFVLSGIRKWRSSEKWSVKTGWRHDDSWGAFDQNSRKQDPDLGKFLIRLPYPIPAFFFSWIKINSCLFVDTWQGYSDCNWPAKYKDGKYRDGKCSSNCIMKNHITTL